MRIPMTSFLWQAAWGTFVDHAVTQGVQDLEVVDISLTAGEGGMSRDGVDRSPGELARHRRLENSLGLAAILGANVSRVTVTEHRFGGFDSGLRDGDLLNQEDMVHDVLESTLGGRSSEQTLLMGPDEHGFDGHPDHIATQRAVRFLAEKFAWARLEFSMPTPDHGYTIAEQTSGVRQLVLAHASQFGPSGEELYRTEHQHFLTHNASRFYA